MNDLVAIGANQRALAELGFKAFRIPKKICNGVFLFIFIQVVKVVARNRKTRRTTARAFISHSLYNFRFKSRPISTCLFEVFFGFQCCAFSAIGSSPEPLPMRFIERPNWKIALTSLAPLFSINHLRFLDQSSLESFPNLNLISPKKPRYSSQWYFVFLRNCGRRLSKLFILLNEKFFRWPFCFKHFKLDNNRLLSSIAIS